MKFAAIGAIVLVLALGAGALWLANAHMMPAPQKVQQTIPDAGIPR